MKELLFVAYLLNVIALIQLSSVQGSLTKKLPYIILMVVPIIGALIYWGMYEIPEPMEGVHRVPDEQNDRWLRQHKFLGDDKKHKTNDIDEV